MNNKLLEQLRTFLLDVTVEQYEAGDAAATHRVRQQQYNRARTLFASLTEVYGVGEPGHKAETWAEFGALAALREQNHARQEAEALFECEDIERGDRDYGFDEIGEYTGRGMVATGGRQSVSPLAYHLYSRNQGPESGVGKALAELGFWSDNFGIGWIYYLRGE